MLVVYGMADGGALELRLGGGHAAIALTGLGHDSTYISWIRKGRSPVFDVFKKGPFGDPVYRVCIPSNEDVKHNIGISERAVYRWIYKELAGEGLRRYRENPNLYTVHSLPFSPLYYEYNCVEIVKKSLYVSQAYDYAKPILPTFTVAGVCSDAARIRRAVLRRIEAARLPLPPEKASQLKLAFFSEDRKRGQNLEPGSLRVLTQN
ncbi:MULTISPECIES: hypothetical protein [unclassified Chelatococcus]|uniref:hypothetical protein n=1 Tax=unclassified Chelatococcus TaxID=2638111 RepID=UPI001BCEEB4D|nr:MULTISPECIES: hypothetical protein [unclassified Chelatococcus]MBS7697885.1 hypothetical protein [Chelatococcus sp. YT9]MBX3558538.1 hypothetical protein [Chelatococcus sp.]